MQNFELISFATADELAARAACAWLDEIAAANHAARPHCVALSGGRIALKFFTSVVKLIREGCRVGDPNFRDGDTPSLPENVHFFWADERCVPPDNAESNFKMANELLFSPLKISANQIHRIRGEDLPESAVKIAEAELCRIMPCKNSLPALDFIFLGMGEDGHVASLFPNAAANVADVSAPFLVVNHSPKPPPTRISMSYQMIFAAKNIWILASGAGKEAALRESLSPKGDTPLARVIRARPVKIFSDIGQF
jgi:6-phosphogluconolactonase